MCLLVCDELFLGLWRIICSPVVLFSPYIISPDHYNSHYLLWSLIAFHTGTICLFDWLTVCHFIDHSSLTRIFWIKEICEKCLTGVNIIPNLPINIGEFYENFWQNREGYKENQTNLQQHGENFIRFWSFMKYYEANPQ